MMAKVILLFLFCWAIVIGLYEVWSFATKNQRLTFLTNSFKLILSALVASVLFVIIYFFGNIN